MPICPYRLCLSKSTDTSDYRLIKLLFIWKDPLLHMLPQQPRHLGEAAVFSCRIHRMYYLFRKVQLLQWKWSGSNTDKSWHLLQPRLSPLPGYLSEKKLTWPIWSEGQFSLHLQFAMSRFYILEQCISRLQHPGRHIYTQSIQLGRDFRWETILG